MVIRKYLNPKLTKYIIFISGEYAIYNDSLYYLGGLRLNYTNEEKIEFCATLGAQLVVADSDSDEFLFLTRIRTSK